MHQFTSRDDVPQPQQLLELAQMFQEQPNVFPEIGKGKVLGLFFFNASLRTRLSTQKAARLLGMEVMSMNFSGEGWALEFGEGIVMDQGKAEHVKEAAGVLSAYCDIIGIRSFPKLKDRDTDYAEEVLGSFCNYASVPVISLEGATRHPLQSLADWLTITQFQPAKKPKVVLTWAPHPKALPQSVANSFLEWMQPTDVDLHIAHPPGFAPAPEFMAQVTAHTDQDAALADADFVYAKNWSSYTHYGEIGTAFSDWQITTEKMALTHNAYFMHCLPVRRNVVVSDAVLDGSQSIVIQQAANRVPAAQAVLYQILHHEKHA